jgi:3-dehydrosphinganine reductase
VYTGTKYALKGIAESLRLELIPYNMRVNLVCPGFVETALLNDGE